MRPSSRGLSSHGQSPAEEGLAGIAFGLVEVHIVVEEPQAAVACCFELQLQPPPLRPSSTLL